MSTLTAAERKRITKLTQRVQCLEGRVRELEMKMIDLAKELAEAKQVPAPASMPPVWPSTFRYAFDAPRFMPDSPKPQQPTTFCQAEQNRQGN